MNRPGPGLAALERLCARIEADPASGEALLLYGFLKSLQMEQRGAVFALARLRLLDAEARAEVYAVMELYARQAHRDPAWQALVERMDALVAASAR